METRVAESDIGTHSVTIPCIEPGRRIHEHGTGIHFTREPHGGIIVRRCDDSSEARALRLDLLQGLVAVCYHLDCQQRTMKLGMPILLLCWNDRSISGHGHLPHKRYGLWAGAYLDFKLSEHAVDQRGQELSPDHLLHE